MSSTTRSDAPARGSLAVRLTLWYALSAFALILAATGYLYWALSINLDREDDGTLTDQIHILRVLLRDHSDDAQGIRQEVEVESSARQHMRMYIRILDENERPLLETAGMASRLPPPAFPPPYDESGGRREGLTTKLSKETFRLMSARAALGSRDRARLVQVALDRSEEEKLLAQFRRRLVPLLGASLFLCALAGYQIARRGLRPLERISRSAARIRSTTLHERIAARDFPAELGTLARTFNEMLDRLQESFDRLSRFSADLAHELRTPINNLRGEVEVTLGRARSPEEYRETLTSFLEEAGRLTRLIESLLFLARAEHPETQVRRETLDVARELQGVRDFYEAAAGEAGVAIDLRVEGPVSAELDRTLLQRAVGNLVENSLAHTPKGGTVTLAAARENGKVKVEVADSGRGIGAEHLPHVFDRLYRADRSRAAATGGAGLGLAIVKSIAELHGGTAEIASEVGKGTRVTLLLPAEPPAITKK